MKTGTWLRGVTALTILMATTPGLALPVPLDITSANNGITDLWSTTFDGSLTPCSGSSPSYCTFFAGGEPGSPARQILITPKPTGVINAIPLGFAITPASGSYLDLTLNGPRTQLTLAGGTLAFPPLVLSIQGTTNVNANGAGVVFDAAPQTATVDANGRAEFLVQVVLPGGPLKVVGDFSGFTTVAFAPIGSCAGPLCGLISILTLDMVRYRLLIDYDPTFTSFTGTFIGQTANNSQLSITMDAVLASAAICEDFSGQVNQDSINNAIPTASRCTGFGSPLTLAVTTPPTHGTANVNGSDIVYTPGLGYFGPDALTYQGSDGTNTDSGVLTITVVNAPPDISVTDDTLPADDLLIPFGNVTEGTTRDRTITVTNNGNLGLVIGAIGGSNPLAAPFSIVTDNCSTRTVAPAANCTVLVRYAPPGTGAASDSLNIPSNDPDEASVIVSVTGTGITMGEGGVPTPSPSGASSGFMAIDPATLLLLGAAGVYGWRRRQAR